MPPWHWRPIPGYPRYDVSSCGCVRSWANSGHVPDRWKDKPRRMRPFRARDGYAYCDLVRNGQRKRFSVPRLVLMAFVGPPLPGQQAAHLDGSRNNDRLTNLQWAYPKENNAHKKGHGTYLCGRQVPSSKLTAATVRRLRSLPDPDVRKVAAQLKVSHWTIYDILSRRTWRHV
jgi:hypothetical protein